MENDSDWDWDREMLVEKYMSGFVVVLFSILGSVELSNIASVCGRLVEVGGRVVLRHRPR